jgi:pectin methylesterase-like acyl-CoA thioesterase
MKKASQFSAVLHRYSQTIPNITAATLAIALGLSAGAGNSFATTYSWTNTDATAVLTDPNSWTPIGGPGGPADTFTYLRNGTFTVQLTNDFANIGSFQFGATTAGQPLTVTLDFGTNVFAGLSGNTTSASGFVFGQQGGSTCTVFISVGMMLCTNSTGNARLIGGRNGPAFVNLTNGFVADGNLVIANGTGANGSKVVVSGPNSFWSNSTTILVGNGSGTANNSLVVSNSGSMVSLSTTRLGNSGTANSLLLDSNGRLFTKNSGSIGSTTGSSGNTATIQGGALWDCGGQQLFIGNGSGFNNALIVGDNGTVSNCTMVTLTAAGNSLVLSGGVLSASSGVNNTAGTVSGYGTIVGNVTFVDAGSLSPGLDNSVGTLTFSNDLTLASTSTTIIKLDKDQAGSNDLLKVAGTASQGGTLIIDNVGADLVGGDTFKILAFTGQSGSFATTNLPSLTGTLIWDTTQLGSQGIISVVLPPTITVPDPQAVFTNTDVTISTVVTGVPTPSLQWQLGGLDLADGPTGNGSTISGSTSDTLSISNAQVADSGQYCLIASNFAGSVTNCMTLEVTEDTAAPLISGPTDQNVVSPNDATFSAVVAGIPTPTVKWQENGVDIPDATNTSVTIPAVTFARDGYVYSIIASNSAGTATNSAVLHVVVPPDIQTQPVSLVVTQTQSATFTVVSTNGVPDPTFQWYFNNVPITDATNTSYTIASAVPANAGAYHVTVANVVGSVTSTDATLTVLSTMSAALTPSNSAVNVCYDTPLYLAFDRVPVSTGAGKIQIFNVTDSVTPVDTIDTSLGNLQPRTIGTETFNTYPVIITGNTVAVYPHLGVLSSNQTYYVTVDLGTFTDTNGALFAGITDTNAWQFTTKSAPATPNNLEVAADGGGDFCTVQGAVDSLPSGNTTYTLVNIQDGTYTEIVDTRTKNNITFRGQSRTGTIVGYPNNNNNNGSTHSRMAFKIFSDDIAIENMTVVNTTPQGGSQAEALMFETSIKRFILNNAEVDSRQDTILANTSTTQVYFNNSLVKGNFDYVWGGGNCFFTNCEFQTIPTANSYNLTAARTENGGTGNWQGPDGNFSSNGFSFVDCRFTRATNSVANITLAGGNGNADANVAWISCHFDTAAYTPPQGSIVSNSIFWVYANSNLDNTASATFDLITVLTNGDARLVAASDATIWLNGWTPQLAPNIVSGPTNLTVTPSQSATFTVDATGVPEPLSYQWLKDGTNVVGATSDMLNIPSADAGDAGAYSVIVSNSAGSVTSSSASLTVLLTPFQTWQQQYFGCTLCPEAAADADPDGDGLTNDAEFLAGTDPTNSASGLLIISTEKQGNDVAITWTTAGGRTNAVQATAGDASGGYSTNGFTDISGAIEIPGNGDATTNFVDVGGATNGPSRYYRIRLVP